MYAEMTLWRNNVCSFCCLEVVHNNVFSFKTTPHVIINLFERYYIAPSIHFLCKIG